MPPGAAISTVEPLLHSATELHRAGSLLEARRLYAECLAIDPRHPEAWFRSGLLDLQEQRAERAESAIRQAALLAPAEGRYWLGLGHVLSALARWDEAVDTFRRALACNPGWHDGRVALAAALHRAGRLRQAADEYRESLAHAADDPAALGGLGAVLREMGDNEGSVHCLERALELDPNASAHGVNLGIALIERRDFVAAATLLRRVLTLDPGQPEAAYNLGNALRGLGRTREAADSFRLAAELRPGYADALNNLGNARKELGELTDAKAAYEAALRACPDHRAAMNNVGCTLRTQGRLDAAEDMLRRALTAHPRDATLLANLGNVLKDAGALEEGIGCFRQSLALDPTNATTHASLAYSLCFQSLRPAPIRAEAERWAACFARPVCQLEEPALRDRSPDRRLAIGYVSADFRDHCQTSFTLPLLSRHDRAGFRIVCYSSVERPDAFTRRIAAHADLWREVRALDDDRLCRLIRDDEIDILVDLTMHMSNGRPLLFARKPAPVQIAWLASPGTTGMSAIDFRLSDPRLDPDGFEDHYTERTLRLPDSFWCYAPLTDAPPVNALPAAQCGTFTFGCLNNPCKITGPTLELWAGVLRELPAAQLLVMVSEGRARQRLAGRLAAHGVAAQRVQFVAFRPRTEYLHTYQRIDLCLDTHPYNGHTTSLDALWMGVPTVTRVGETCVGRGGLSQLHQLGLTELAAPGDRDFVDIAVALAKDLPRLGALRSSLRGRLASSPLMDAVRFARNIEAAYRAAWRDHVSRPSG